MSVLESATRGVCLVDLSIAFSLRCSGQSHPNKVKPRHSQDLNFVFHPSGETDHVCLVTSCNM